MTATEATIVTRVQNRTAFIDPAILELVAEAVIAVIELIAKCHGTNTASAVKVLRNPSRLDKVAVRWRVTRVAGYGFVESEILKALYAEGQTIPAEEVGRAIQGRT